MDWPCRNGDCEGRLRLGMRFCDQCAEPVMYAACGDCPGVQHAPNARICSNCGVRLTMSPEHTEANWDAGSDFTLVDSASQMQPNLGPPPTHIQQAVLQALSTLSGRFPSPRASEVQSPSAEARLSTIEDTCRQLQDGHGQLEEKLNELESRFSSLGAARENLEDGLENNMPENQEEHTQTDEDRSQDHRTGVYKRYIPSTPEVTKIKGNKVTISWESVNKESLKRHRVILEDLIGYNLKLIDPQGHESVTYSRLDELKEYNIVVSQTGQYKLSICSIFKDCLLSDYSETLQFEVPVIPPSPFQNVKQISESTTHDCIGLTWDINTVYDISKIIIQYKLASEDELPKDQEITKNTSCTIESLEPGQAYEIRISSICNYLGDRQSEYSESSTMYTWPGPPVDFHGTPNSRGYIDLSWKAPECVGGGVVIEKYVVECVDSTGKVVSTETVTSTQRTRVANGYLYRVKAVCGTGEPEARYHSPWAECQL